ncbi:MAG: SDR family oxidoreductase [Candidatus Omnitrophota bacterium]|nr:SDR family oxidoreductase [Candidatus Omnitrophota bacterium]
MRLLITGALGHIGSRLIRDIKKDRFSEVRLIDNMLTQRYSSLFNLPSGVKFGFYEEDICKADLDRYFKGVDVVIHLAAMTDAASTFDKKELVEEVNYLGTKRVAEACLRNKCRLIFPSTTSVYGTQSDIVDECCSVGDLKPQSPYAESKLKAEQLLIRLGEENNLKFVICRLGTIFGTSIGMRFHTAVNKFVWQACLGRPVTVWRTAMDQRRPYLDLDDAVRSFFHIIERRLFSREIYNIVTVNLTVAEIIGIIKKRIPSLRVEYVDCAIMNQLTYTVYNDKFKKTGFRFRGRMEKGVNDTIKILSGANRP